jgi:hypothetical protein
VQAAATTMQQQHNGYLPTCVSLRSNSWTPTTSDPKESTSQNPTCLSLWVRCELLMVHGSTQICTM